VESGTSCIISLVYKEEVNHKCGFLFHYQ